MSIPRPSAPTTANMSLLLSRPIGFLLPITCSGGTLPLGHGPCPPLGGQAFCPICPTDQASLPALLPGCSSHAPFFLMSTVTLRNFNCIFLMSRSITRTLSFTRKFMISPFSPNTAGSSW